MNDISLAQAIGTRRSVREFSSKPIKLPVVKRLLEVAQGPTNDAGNRPAPSAQATYPLQFFVAVGSVSGLETGFYECEQTTSELVLRNSADIRTSLKDAAVDDQTWIENAALVLTVCGDAIAVASHFADQMPFGSRGERYMYLEAGAVAQNLMLTAVSEGLGSVLIAGFRDEQTSSAMGLEAPLVPILHICIGNAS